MAEQSTTSGGLSNVSMSTMIHVAIECVMIGGVVYLITSKTNALQEQITVLSDTIKKQNEQLAAQADLITKHENAIRQLYAAIQQIPINQPQYAPQQEYVEQPHKPRQPPRPLQTQQTQQPQSQPRPQQPQSQPRPQQPQQSANFNQTSPRRQPPKPKSQERVIEEEPQVEEIDDLLADELNELNNENEGCGDEGCLVDHSDDQPKTNETTSTFSKKKVHS